MKFVKTAAVFAAALLAVSYFPIKNHITSAETTEDSEIVDAVITGYEGNADDPQTFRVITANSETYQTLANATARASSLKHNSRFSDCIMQDGIDVSKYNGSINWSAVKADGIDFAIARVGYRGYDAGLINLDPYFHQHMQGAIDAGLNVGAYFYTQAISVQEAVEEAKYCIKQLEGYNLTMPVYFDVEATEGNGKNGRLNTSGLTIKQRTAIAEAFCQTIEEAGYEAGIYSCKSYFLTYLDPDYLATKYKIWLANYSSQTSYSGDYHMWQYTASGSVDGISGNVDMNVLYSKKVQFADETLLFADLETSSTPFVTGEGTFTFASSDPSVATVDESGTITPISDGTAVVTVSSTNGSQDTLLVRVDIPNYTGLKYSGLLFNSIGDRMIVCRGGSTLTSSDADVVSIAEDGSATAVGTGRATLTAVDENGNSSVCEVLVSSSDPQIGDCNLDGLVNAIDAVYILNMSSELGVLGTDENAEDRFSEAYWNLYDFNGDGKINSLDASDVLVKSAYAGVGIDYSTK